MATDIDLIKTLTRDVLMSAAPDEIILLDDFDPAASNFGTTSSGPQGFGAGVVIALLLPFVYKFFDQLVQKAGGRAGDDLYTAIRDWIKGPTPLPESALRSAVQTNLAAQGMVEPQLAAVTEPILIVVVQNRQLLAARM